MSLMMVGNQLASIGDERLYAQANANWWFFSPADLGDSGQAFTIHLG